MSTSNRPQIEKRLLEIYQANRPFLAEYPWEWEQDRWAELVMCILITEGQLEPDRARNGVQILKELDLITPDRLADANSEDKLLLQSMIARLGAEKSTAENVSTLLVKVAAAVIKRWGGHVQRFLREHGQRLAEDLAAALVPEGMSPGNARKSATLWLQNVANIPLLLTDAPHIRDFCNRENVGEEELVEIADQLGINVAVLDDLLSFESAEVAEGSFTESQVT